MIGDMRAGDKKKHLQAGLARAREVRDRACDDCPAPFSSSLPDQGYSHLPTLCGLLAFLLFWYAWQRKGGDAKFYLL
jgi:hypothetical protein